MIFSKWKTVLACLLLAHMTVHDAEAAGKPSILKPNVNYDPSELPPKSPFKLPSRPQPAHEKQKLLPPGHTCPNQEFINRHTCLDCNSEDAAFESKQDKGFGNRDKHHLMNVNKKGVTYYATDEKACYNHPSQYYKCTSSFCFVEGDECTAGHSTSKGHFWWKTVSCCPHHRFLRDHHCKHCKNAEDVQQWLKKHKGVSWVLTGDLSFDREPRKGKTQPDVCVSQDAPLYQCDEFDDCFLVGTKCTTSHKLTNGAPLSVPGDFQLFYECQPEETEEEVHIDSEEDEDDVPGAVADLTSANVPDDIKRHLFVTPAKDVPPRPPI